MDAPVAGERRFFGRFRLDPGGGRLFRQDVTGDWEPVAIGSRALDILRVLLRSDGAVVSKDTIMDEVWSGVAVEPNNLSVQIAALRRVLDVGSSRESCIQAVPGRGYRLVVDVAQAVEAQPNRTPASLATSQRDAEPGWRPWRWRIASVAIVVLLALLLIVSWQVVLFSAAAVPRRLSLVVLPFDNLETDAADNSTAEGITEDLTTLIAQFPDFSVAARNSALAYRGKPIDIRRVGDELGVRYAAEGSIRRVDGVLRVNMQLVSTETGTHLWANHFDVGHDGSGSNVDDVVRGFGVALGREIVDIEAARGTRERPANPDGFDLMLQARALTQGRPHSPDLVKQVLALYEEAVRLDPSSATALAGLAEALLDSHSYLTDDPAMPAILHRSEELVAKAELLQPQNQKVMWTRVYLLAKEDRCEQVIPAAKRAVEFYPTNSGPYFRMGLCLLWDGKTAEAIPVFEQAIRADPRNPQNYNRYGGIGRALAFLERYDEAIPWLERSLAANPSMGVGDRGSTLATIAAARALGGHAEQAHADADEVIRLWPTFTARSYYQVKLTSPIAVAQFSRMRDGLREAGIRDHADEDAEFHVPSDEMLHIHYEAHTPKSVPGARTIGTHELAIMIQQSKPLIIDASIPWGASLPGAIGLLGVGVGGSVTDEYQSRLGSKMQALTHGDQRLPVVTMGWNAERYQGRNLALRLVALGYTNVYWYRGGREAWEVAGLPEIPIAIQDW